MACLFGSVVGDCYLSNPRGSNNRLNEQSATRNNGDRLFDSQNNARGGYNTGDRYSGAAGNDPKKQYAMQFYASGPTAEEASKMVVEWTNQHGCGKQDSPHKTNCNLVLQMMCQSQGSESDYPTGQGNGATDVTERNFYMRDGTTTNTQNYNQPNVNEYNTDDMNEKNKKYDARMTGNYNNVQTNRGLQETLWWYDMCRWRSRNKQLYIADQDLNAGSLGYVGSERTRQNNNGNRRGYECPEERDYYPYWAPTHQSDFVDKYQTTPWIDVAYVTGNMSDCERVSKGTENRVPKFRCVMPAQSSRKYGKSINKESCEMEGGCILDDVDFTGSDLTSTKVESFEECMDKCRERDDCKSITMNKYSKTCWLKNKEYGNKKTNHVVMSANKKCFDSKIGGTWVEFYGYLEIISAAKNEPKCNEYKNKDKKNKISWMPLRSDMPDDKYCVVQAPEPKCEKAPFTRVNHLGNSADTDGEASRIEIDMPYFPSGLAKRCTLRMRYNITTDEFDNYGTDSRHNYDQSKGVISPVEQDPIIDVSGGMSKPLRLAMNTNQYGRTFQDRTHIFKVLPRIKGMEGRILHNLNVRGKRGNIVQTFPAVEYDFVPNKLTMPQSDLLHIQWTGSNTHNNGNNGGDGQTGDAGEGTGGTDRHNFLQMLKSDLNYPMPYEQTNFWDSVESVNYPSTPAMDLAIGYATSGYYCGYKRTGDNMCPSTEYVTSNKDAMQQQLNNAPASYFGHVLKFNKAGVFFYICTRNNNFTNRSQKGVLTVTA